MRRAFVVVSIVCGNRLLNCGNCNFGASFSATKQNVQLHPFSSLDFLHGHFPVLNFPQFSAVWRTFCYDSRMFDIRLQCEFCLNRPLSPDFETIRWIQSNHVEIKTEFKPIIFKHSLDSRSRNVQIQTNQLEMGLTLLSRLFSRVEPSWFVSHKSEAMFISF